MSEDNITQMPAPTQGAPNQLNIHPVRLESILETLQALLPLDDNGNPTHAFLLVLVPANDDPNPVDLPVGVFSNIADPESRHSLALNAAKLTEYEEIAVLPETSPAPE